MPLQKQKIPLALSSGMDTKSDEFNATSFKLVENLKYNKSPGLVKRPGGTDLSKSIIGVESSQSNISSGTRIIGSTNAVLLSDDKELYHYASEQDQWKKISNDANNYINNSLKKCEYSETNIFNNVNFVISSASDKTSKYKISAALKSSNPTSTYGPKLLIKITSIDEGNLIYDKAITISSIATDAKVAVNVISETYALVIFNASDGGLSYVLITMNAGYITISNITSLISSISSIAFDTIVYNGIIYMAYVDGYSIIHYCKINQTGIISSASTGDMLSDTPYFVNICKYANGFRIFYFQGGFDTPNHDLRHLGIDTSLAVTYSPTTILSAASGKSILSVAAISDNTNTYVFYNTANQTSLTGVITSSPDNGDTYTTLYATTILDSNNSVVTSQTDILTSGLIQTKPYILANNIYIGVCKVYGQGYATQNSTFYLININPSTLYKNIVGVSKYLNYVPSLGFNSLKDPVVIGNTLEYTLNENLTIGYSDYYSPTILYSDALQNVYFASFNFDSKNNSYATTRFGTYIGGPVLKLYDGATLSEASFVDTPFIYGVRRVVGGTITGGSYGFAVVARWTDNYGNVHRSAPVIKTFTLTASYAYELLIGGVGITDKELVKASSTMGNIAIEIYQTTLGGSVYYLQSYITNIKFSNIYTFVSDASILTDTEILYTNSGELENDIAPSSDVVADFKNRIWSLGNNKIKYSKEKEEGYGVSFSELLYIDSISATGNIKSIAGMDNSMVIFTENGIQIVSGEGPNSFGQGNGFTKPQPISSDIGCTEPNSVINTPEGIMFKGKKGIYILNRGLYVSYIGAEVEFYNQYPIISAKLVQNKNEVRFLLNNNQIICYDYLYKKWNVETYAEAIDLTVQNNDVYLLKSNGTVTKQVDTVFKDGSSYYSGKFETNWITVGSINVNGSAQTTAQGFQRLYTINILGKYKSAHELKVSLAYNYNDTVVDYATIVPSGTGVYQFEVKPSIQKCESFKVIVEDQNQSGTGESMVVSHILLEVGIRGSAQKVVADSNRFPAT